jgi:tRNA1(Val) A37 N6-methylase TrmN6
MFAPDELSDDAFLGGALQLLQPRQGYRAATDPVLLAAAVPAHSGQRVLELGCGVGTAILCLGHRVPGLALFGVERQPAYAGLARANAARNGQEVQVIEGDIARLPAELRRPFDHVLVNPPYFPAGGGTAATDPGREAALREDTPLALWIDTATRRLAPGGWLTLIHLAERLPDLMAALDGRLGTASLLPLQPRAGRPASRLLLRARKGGRGAFRLLPPLILHDGAVHDGDRDSFTPDLQAVLRQGASLQSRFG